MSHESDEETHKQAERTKNLTVHGVLKRVEEYKRN